MAIQQSSGSACRASSATGISRSVAGGWPRSATGDQWPTIATALTNSQKTAVA